jgi:hypothetical protein
MNYRKLSRSGLRRSRANVFFPQLMQMEARALMTVTPVVGPNINVSQVWYNQSETQIAVNPTDPKNLFVVSNQDYEHNNPDNLVFGRYSMDGGKTWHTPETPKPLNYPPFSLDPGVVFDRFGNLYVSYKAAVRGSYLAVIISTDGGQHFNTLPGRLIQDDQGVDFDSLAVGPANAADPEGDQYLWVCYNSEDDSGEGTGGMKVIHTLVTGLGYVGQFSSPEMVPRPPGVKSVNFGNIAVGPQGQVAVTFMDASKNYRLGPEKIYVAIDPKGAKGRFQPAELVTTTNWGWNIYVPAANNYRGTFAEPFLAYDDSSSRDSHYSGRLYLSYLNSPRVPGEHIPFQDSSVYVRYLDKTGRTWSEPVRVSKGDGDAGTAFLPSISVDPKSGLVGATWYDSRRVGGERASVFAAFSDNGGKSFSTSVRVSKEASNAGKSNPTNQDDRQGFGDYVRNAFYDKVFYASWADNSDSTKNNPNGPDSYLDLYTARIEVRPQKLKPGAKAHQR